jgi:HSP20 family protein
MFSLPKPTTYQLGFASYSPLSKDLNQLIHSALDITESKLYHKLNLEEDDTNYYLFLELPGYKNTEIDISVEDSVLSITAKNEKRGATSRSISLWSGLDIDKVVGKVEDGVLTITLPKLEKIKPKKVKVD